MSTQIIPVQKNNLVSSGGKAVINPLKSRILGEVLKEASTLAVKKYKVLEWELNEPDYQWLINFFSYFNNNTFLFEELIQTLHLKIENGSIIVLGIFFSCFENNSLNFISPKDLDFTLLKKLKTLIISDIKIDWVLDINLKNNNDLEHFFISSVPTTIADSYMLSNLETYDNVDNIPAVILPSNQQIVMQNFMSRVTEKLWHELEVKNIILPKKSSLKSLCVSGIFGLNLIDLDLSDQFELATLDLCCTNSRILKLPDSLKLNSIDISFLLLNEIDFSKNLNLKTLRMSMLFNMNKLDISNLDRLEVLGLWDLYQIKDMYLYNQKQLRSLTLVSINSLNELNLSQQKDLISLDLRTSLNNLVSTTNQMQLLKQRNQLENISNIVLID